MTKQKKDKLREIREGKERMLREALDALAQWKRFGKLPSQMSPEAKMLLSATLYEHPDRHSADFHCLVDPDIGICVVCGVEHGAPCPVCSGRAFHSIPCRWAEGGVSNGVENGEA